MTGIMSITIHLGRVVTLLSKNAPSRKEYVEIRKLIGCCLSFSRKETIHDFYPYPNSVILMNDAQGGQAQIRVDVCVSINI